MKRRISDASRSDSREARARRPPSFGVIVPALDEADVITATVQRLRDSASVVDVVVADGGSTDGTVDAARRAGARVVVAPAGRGAQMNRGAAHVRGDTLLFLHADCRLPSNAFELMVDVLHTGRDAGLFAVDYEGSSRLLRLVSRLSHLRTRWTEFGEGALFVRRARFERLGGFPEWPLFEDVALLARLRAAGTLGRARGRVTASPRRYLRRGVLRQLLLNATLYGLFHLGVSPRRLHDWYEGGERRRVPAGARDGRRPGARARNSLHPAGGTRYRARCLESPLRPPGSARRRDAP